MYVDISLPTFNGERYLGRFFESLCEQSDNSWRVTIRDDGSEDSTLKIVRKFKEEHPDRVIIISDTRGNLGVCENTNLILQKISGYQDSNYIMLADQDDVWLPDKISMLKKEIISYEVSSNSNIPILVHSDLKVVDQYERIIAHSMWKYQKFRPTYSMQLNRLLVQNLITGCTVIFNKRLLDCALPIPKEAIMHDWWLGLVAVTFGKVRFVSKPTVMYRQHNANQIGAEARGYVYLFDNIKKGVKGLHITIDGYKKQAESLCARCKKIDRIECPRALQEFLSIDNYGFFVKRYKLIKYSILKSGIMQNVGLLIGI